MIGDALSLPVSSIPSRSMPVEAVRKIRDLVRAGATVVGPRPEMASGLKDYPRADDEVRQIADEVWGDCDGKTRTEHRYGLGRVFWGKTPREILAGTASGRISRRRRNLHSPAILIRKRVLQSLIPRRSLGPLPPPAGWIIFTVR